MDLDELARISLTAPGVEKLCGLGAPDSESLKGSPRQSVAALDNLLVLWRDLVTVGSRLPVDLYEFKCPHGRTLKYEGADLRSRVLLSVAGYFDVLYREYLSHDHPGKSLPAPKAKTISAWQAFLPTEEAIPDDPRTVSLGIASHSYLFVMATLNLVALFRRAPVPKGMVSTFESLAHSALKDLASYTFELQGDTDRFIGRRLTHGALAYADFVYSDTDWNQEHRMGAFSAIRLEELSPLARREDAILERYGVKNVEKVFEHQLALVLQSFGLHVVSTRTGQSTVDLVCIAGSSDDRLTFLVEAKSTKANYSLPKRDSRALKDYVDDVRRGLSSLPPLQFVLVVSGTHARTLNDKIGVLEAEIGLPVRFMAAQQLAHLRERIAGPLPLSVFVQELLTGTRIVDDALVDRVSEAYEAEEDAHRAFVEAMMCARGVIPGGHDWVEKDDERHPVRGPV